MAPEIGDVGIEVGPIEIFGDLDAKEPSRTDGDVGIGGKVGVNFDAIGKKPKRKRGALGLCDVVNVQVVGIGGEKIRDGEFFSQGLRGCA